MRSLECRAVGAGVRRRGGLRRGICQQSRYAPHDRDGVAIFIYDMSIYYLWFSFFACSRLYGVRYKNVTKDVKKAARGCLNCGHCCFNSKTAISLMCNSIFFYSYPIMVLLQL